ncbi:UNVERIFIED_CONTAM: hypothetical protein K2H54_024378 [Gekko kuhli]
MAQQQPLAAVFMAEAAFLWIRKRRLEEEKRRQRRGGAIAAAEAERSMARAGRRASIRGGAAAPPSFSPRSRQAGERSAGMHMRQGAGGRPHS